MNSRARASRAASAAICRRLGAPFLLVATVILGCATPAPIVAPDPGETSPIVSSDPVETRTRSVYTFPSDARFRAYLEKLSALEEERRAYLREKWESRIHANLEAAPVSSVAFSAEGLEKVVVDSAFLADSTPSLVITGEADSITNNQESGVDEGDIVKRIGEYVLLLRRGRLFSFSIGRAPGSPLRLVDRIDLPPEIPTGEREVDSWYDEMLVDATKVVVIGYNYGVGAVEIELFRLSAEGKFSRIDTIFMSSYDYFDSSNYASRLVGGDLILYSPIPIDLTRFAHASNAPRALDGPSPIWPMRIFYSPQGEPTGVAPLVFESRVLLGVQSFEDWPVLHAVLRCPLNEGELRCSAIGILGPYLETHYMSRNAFYLWLTAIDWIFDVESIDPAQYRDRLEWEDFIGLDRRNNSVVYRIPLDEAPSDAIVGAVEVRGNPNDQFAFRESPSALEAFAIDKSSKSIRNLDPNNHSDVGRLIEIPLADFAPQLRPWNEVAYRELPVDSTWCVINRFVGEYLVYANCDPWSDERANTSRLRMTGIDPDAPLYEIELGYDVRRIEKVGEIALIAGTGWPAPNATGIGQSRLSVFELETTPMLTDEIALEDRRSNFGRSHAFNFSEIDDGMIVALPFDLAPDSLPDENAESKPLTEIEYFRLTDDSLISSMGAIAQAPESNSIDDKCRASCYDWYGSARPFFVGSRIFGLIDYELVEAEAIGESLHEIQRASALTDRPD